MILKGIFIIIENKVLKQNIIKKNIFKRKIKYIFEDKQKRRKSSDEFIKCQHQNDAKLGGLK